MTEIELICREVANHLPHGGEIRRLFHGRGHCFSGVEDVVIDAYPPLLVVYLYRSREDDWLKTLTERLLDCCDGCTAVAVQHRYRPQTPFEFMTTPLEEPLEAVEDGLRYRLRLSRTQNIGFFPDMAVGRRWVRRHAAGKRVLNLFAYSCSFSVAALAGGAKQVVNLDMSKSALELGRINHQLNDLDLRAAGFLAMELFRSHSRLRKLAPFDLVICDPPAQQGKSFTAQHHWPKLLQRLPQWLEKGGEALLCVNGPHLPDGFMAHQLQRYLPQAAVVGQFTPGEDFPERDSRCATTIYHLQLS